MNEKRISVIYRGTYKVLLFVFLLILLIACEKPERILEFDTLEAESSDISVNTATLKGEIIDLGSKPIEQHGLLLSESSVPELGQQNTIEKPLGTINKKGVFQAEFTGLKSNMTYYFRAFVVVNGTSELSSIKQFQTPDSRKPTVTAGTVTGITMTSASLDGEVTSDGGEPTTVRGLCWSLSANPTFTSCLDTTKNGSGSGTFTGNMTGLTAGTQYYARTYATNSKGTSYNAADITFKTHSLPVVTTSAITNISTTSASSGGEVTDDGGVTVTVRGVCWSTTAGPTIALTTKTENGTGKGEFTSSITELTPETTYYVRAYATNQYGTSYGAELSFTASASVLPPSATTSSATPVGTTTATLNGLVNANGLSTTVTFEYGTTTSYGQTATAAESPVTGSSATSVSAAVTGLLPSTTYHFRVKAVSSGGTAYGNDMTFTTNAAPIAPAATTGSATSVSSSGAILNGTVNANNSSTTVTFEYGTTTSYGTEVSADQNPVTGSTETSVSKSISGLSASTTYHYRVKAVNAGGTIYGNDASFTTNATLPTVSDYDGNSYNIIAIGTQDWMQKNLMVTHYSNGDEISNVTDNTTWSGLTSGAYCWYDNNEGTYKNTYGALYNWYTTIDIRNLCPSGWHVPSDAEMTTLVDYLGGDNIAGGKLKETGTSHWSSPNTGATNESGFTALPGGHRGADFGTFHEINEFGYWWNTTENSPSEGWSRYINNLGSNAVHSYSQKRDGFSMRCVKGELPLVLAEDATIVTATSATLNGQVNPNNASTTVTFEYGETTSYGSEVTVSESPVTGTAPTSVSAGISGLSELTTYHYRVKAVNLYGTTYSEDKTFTTLQPPSASTSAATAIGSTSATLNGTINANGTSTTVTFEYGATTSYGTEVTADQSPVSGNTNTSVNKSISGLSESTTYHFRVKAASPGGTIYGDDMTFTTIDLPTVTTGIVHDITDVSAIAEGEVIDDGGADITERGICYSISTNPTVSDNKVNNAGDIGFFSVTLIGLNPSTKYYYRAYAINIGGTSYGNEYNFITMSSTNLLAYYPFNNNVEDESGNGNHGINNGAIPTYDRFGNANSAMLFNNSYIDCNNSLLPETGDFTINMWVYPDSLACALWGQYAFNTYGRIFAGIDQPSGKIFFFHSSDGSVDIATFNPIETKKWYMLSFIREGNELKIYLNGSIQETGSLTPMNILQRKFLIGIQNESYDLDEGFNGIIDDVRIYDGALTQNDLNNLYQENGWTGELTVCDYDGNPYYVVHIGTQLWMHENLKVIHYNNGGIIPNIAGDTEWEASTSGAYCWYNNNKTTYGDTYGALYKWYTVSTGNLCPTGWHVPTDAEWTILTDYLGGESVAGGKLKETGTTHWTSPNEGATNESGFNALPGGLRLYSGMFNGLSNSSYWWSSTEANASSGYDRVVLYYAINASRNSYNKKGGCYVRCIKD